MVNIACVACLDPEISVHTETFTRAVKLFEKVSGNGKVNLQLYDDRADPDCASDIAQSIVADDVDCVVGHFLSDAASKAAPIYEKAGIPLLLPAASRESLTEHRTTYRVCDSESAYVKWLGDELSNYKKSIVAIENDDSLHSKGLRSVMESLLETPDSEKSCINAYVGKYNNSVSYLERNLRGGNKFQSVLLTDDAYSKEIVSAMQSFELDFDTNEILIAAFKPEPKGEFADNVLSKYQEEYGAKPGAYFWETIAALEIASVEKFYDYMDYSWETVLGELKFSSGRELSPMAYKLLRCDKDGLIDINQSVQNTRSEISADFKRLLSARKILVKDTRNQKDYGRQAAKQWVESYIGSIHGNVTEHVCEDFVRVYKPLTPGPERTLFYLHGGGMVYYDLDVFAPLMSLMCNKLGLSVVAVDYNKLPESPVQDSIEQLIQRIKDYIPGDDAGKPMIMGDSVGGMLALYAALRPLANQFGYVGLVYPMLSLYQQFDSFNKYGKNYLLNADMLRWFRFLIKPYFEAKEFDPLNLAHEELQGVDHISVYSAGCDVLADEGLAFFEQVQKHISCNHVHFDDLPHDFCLYQGRVESAKTGVNKIIDDIKKNLMEK